MVRKGKEADQPTQHHGGGHITVTAQQSRYASDAVDAPASKEILVKDLTISVAHRELLTRSTLHLVEARHYVLIGRNGTGKSTLLRAISDGLVPGIPWSTRILLLGQTRKEDIEQGIGRLKIEETVLQHVVRSDKARERLVKEERDLREAVETATDPIAPVRAYRGIHHDRLARKLKEAHRVAERRSGARGKQARKELIKLEERFETSKANVEQREISPSVLAEETQAAADLLSALQAEMENIEASQAEAKARMVLLGLGFKVDKIDAPISELSGGWRTRCDLACALTQYADVLLLDEPTNFLDLPSIIWLQSYIQNLMGTTVLITTHDRDFGDAVAEELIVLRNQKLENFRGNLSLYEKERWKKMRHMTKMKEAQDKQRVHVQKTIQGNIRAAKDKSDDKKLKQAASRKKKLGERMGLEVSAKGGKFKLNRDLAGYHYTNRAEIEVPDFDPPVKLSFPRQPPDLRFPGALVSLENVSFAYPRHKTPVLSDVTLTIQRGSRTGLAGLNGSGKTTLASLIMGDQVTGGLAPTSGTISHHSRAKFGRFSQQSVEEVTEIASSDPKVTALSHLMDICGPEMEEKDARQLLGSLGLQGQIASNVPLMLLSGGQKVRLGFAKLLWPPPQLLILDEVTTHLDADTILGLANALGDYDGALLVVTHDRFFMRTVVEGESPYKLAAGIQAQAEESPDASADEEETGVPPGTVYRLVKGELKKLAGGMEQYEELAARTAAKLGRT